MAALLLALLPLAVAQGLDISSRDHVLQSADTLAADLSNLYAGGYDDHAGRIDGTKYYYVQGSFLVSTWIDYWHLTGDGTHNRLAAEAVLAQRSDGNFLPADLRGSTLTNDDQCLWGLAAILAAEDDFPQSEDGDRDLWFDVARGVFDAQKARLDLEGEDECSGGLRWGLNASHHGWQWKSSAANACLFDLSARLARYSLNETYADTAVELWDWMRAIGLIEDDFYVNQGAGFSDSANCSDVSNIQTSLPSLLLTQGSAFMYNYTNGTDEWRDRLDGMLQASLDDFFPEGIPFEPDCEIHEQCDQDKMGWRGVNIRALASVVHVAPFAADRALEALEQTARVAAESCTRGKCGTYWYILDEDEDEEHGDMLRQMNALSAISNLLVEEAAAPAVRPPPPPEEEEEDGDGDGEGGDDRDESSEGSEPEKDGDDDGNGAVLSGVSLSLLVVGLASSWLGAKI